MNKTNQILIALWLVIASFIAYLVAGLVTSRESAEQRVRDEAMSYARLVEQHASAALDRASSGLIQAADHVRPEDLIRSKPLPEARRLEIERLLLAQQRRIPGVVAMPLTNASGEIIAHSLGARPGANLSDREHFQALKHQPRATVAISEVGDGRIVKKPGVVIGLRIDLPDGSFGGMLGANLGLNENFTDFYATLALGKDSAVSLRDFENTLLVRYPVVEEKLGKQIAAAGAIRERVLAGDAEGVIVAASAIDNVERVFGFRRLAHYPIYAAVGLSLEQALSGWRLERDGVALGTGLIIAAGIFITVMLRRKERAEDLLHTLAVIVESSDASICAADLNGVITSWNAGAEKLYGYCAVEMIGRSGLVLVPPEKREEYAALIERSGSGEGTANLETVRITRDGRRVDVALAVSSIRDRGGKAIGYSVIARDITERKHAEAARSALEAQLREAQKMEAIGTLAGGIAHDFNNILAAILGNVALARNDLGSGHRALVSLEEINKAGARAKNLVQQILAFSRRQPQKFLAQPLRPLLEDALKLLRATLPAGVELVAALADAPLQVRADATQIVQVLMNLCTNAWQAVDACGGRIGVGLDEVLLDADAAQRLGGLVPGHYARFSVSDNGHGMDAATQARIFEPFFTTKSVDKGTGLGLAVVHGIVKAHHGAINVDSAPGKGARFEVLLPLIAAPAKAAQPPPAVASAVQGGGRHVLYLDDDEAMVFLVSRMLQDLGYRVSGHDSADAALVAVRANPRDFDLVVTDFNMPGHSGLDVARELQRIRPELPVVITSGYITEELTAGANAAGVRHVVYKPNTVDDLCGIIHGLLEKARVLPPAMQTPVSALA